MINDPEFTAIDDTLSDVKEFFTQNPQQCGYSESDNTYIKIPQNQRIYCINKRNRINEGAFGITYTCHRVNLQNLQIEPKLYAVKIIDDRKTFRPIEHQTLTRYYFAEPPLDNGRCIFIVQEYFPGEDLLDKKNQLSPTLQGLDFKESVELILQLCLRLETLHNLTPRGKSLYHGDIKGPNIRVNHNNDNFDVYILDYGLAEIFEDSEKSLTKPGLEGSLLYLAPEILDKQCYSLKADIFALLHPILVILGATAPLSIRARSSRQELSVKPYDFTGVLRNFTPILLTLTHPIADLVTQFLQRMQSPSPELRPSSSELVRFFTSLNNYLLETKRNNNANPSLDYYAVHLILLATNLWSVPITLSNPMTSPGQSIVTINSLDLSAQDNAAIIAAYSKNSLDIKMLLDLAQQFSPSHLKQLLASQLDELHHCRFPKYVKVVLENLIRLNLAQAASTIQAIRSFTVEQHYCFNLLTQLLNRHAVLDTNNITQLAHHCDVSTGIQLSLEYHVRVRLPNEQEGGYLSWFWSRKISKNEEMALAQQLLQCLSNKEEPTIIYWKRYLTEGQWQAVTHTQIIALLQDGEQIIESVAKLRPIQVKKIEKFDLQMEEIPDEASLSGQSYFP